MTALPAMASKAQPLDTFQLVINSFWLRAKFEWFNTLRPNSDLSQTSHCNIKGLSVSEVMRIENMITQVRFC